MIDVLYQNMAISNFGGFNRGVGQSWLHTVKHTSFINLHILKNKYLQLSYEPKDLERDLAKIGLNCGIKEMGVTWDKYLVNDYLYEDNSIDLVHTWDNIPLRTKIPQVVTVHDTFLFADKYRFMGCNLYTDSSTIRDLFYKNVSEIICPSEFSKQDIMEFLPDYKKNKIGISVVPWGSKFGYGLKNTGALRKGKYFLYIGALEERKRFNLLLQAFKDLKEHNIPDIQLVVITDIQAGLNTKDYEKAKKYIKELREMGVTILTNVTEGNMRELIESAKALVLPSDYEGFGLPVVEALSLGCPVICSASSALLEFRDHVYLVSKGCYKELGFWMGRLWKEDHKFDRNEYEYLSNKYSYKNAARKHEEIYYRIHNGN